MTDMTANPAAVVESHDHHDEGGATVMGVVSFLLAVVALIAAVIYGMFAIGLWVLGITALATVPVIYVALILLTTGK